MLKIEKIIPGGQALATNDEGKKIFLWNTLPGEVIEEYIITKKKSRFEEGIATKIKETSTHRVDPEDPCYLSTSPWQNMGYDYELELKKSLVVELYREHQINIKTPEIFTDNNIYHYRNKMEYSLFWDNDNSEIKLAFHNRGSHRKFIVEKSSIERPELFSAASKIVADLNARHEEARKYQSILLRCNQKGEVSGGLFENGKPHPVFPNLVDTILDHEYSYSPNGFFQINLPVYEIALKEIKKYITTDEVLDLYAGVGTIGLSVTDNQKLTMVEVNAAAYGEMEENSKGRDNVICKLAKSEEVLGEILPSQTVILDPPRAGCDEKLINRLIEVKPATIIYLSCNPATQARDVKALLEAYDIKDVKVFNFFPRTPHIENLVVLMVK